MIWKLLALGSLVFAGLFLWAASRFRQLHDD